MLFQVLVLTGRKYHSARHMLQNGFFNVYLQQFIYLLNNVKRILNVGMLTHTSHII